MLVLIRLFEQRSHFLCLLYILGDQCILRGGNEINTLCHLMEELMVDQIIRKRKS